MDKSHHPTRSTGFELRLATESDREAIYRLRHEVYAREIGQHAVNSDERLTDSLDDANVYLVAGCGAEVAGFISLTPPECGRYSIDKYFARGDLPFAVDEGLFEVRLLTAQKPYRGTRVAALLGASPGASASANIVLEVIKKCFPQLLASPEGHARMKEMIPTYDVNIKLPEHADLFREVNKKADEILQLGMR